MNAITAKPAFKPASEAASNLQGEPDCRTVPNAPIASDAASLSRSTGRMMIAHVAAAVICIFFDRIYALFAHGVASARDLKRAQRTGLS